jgi:hypothetical protein
MAATPRWLQWREDSDPQKIRNAATDLDIFEARQDTHDRWHDDRLREEIAWRKHVDDEIDGLKKILLGFIVSAAGIIIVAAINVAVLIVRGG